MAFDQIDPAVLVKWSEVVIGALQGALVAVVFRRPANIWDGIALFAACFSCGFMTAEWIAAYFTVQLYLGAGIGAAFGFTIYQGFMKAIEKVDFRKFLPGGGAAGE